MASEPLEIILHQVEQLSPEERLQLIKQSPRVCQKPNPPASDRTWSTANTATLLAMNPLKTISS